MTSEQSTADPSRKRARKYLPLAIVIAAALIGSFLIYALLISPTKEPYRQALTQYKNVYNANVAFTNAGGSLNASQATPDEFKANIGRLNTAMNSLKIENEALGRQSVLKEGEGKALYDAFSTKLLQYLEYNKTIINSIEIVRPVLHECSKQKNEVNAEGAAAFRSCAQSLYDLKDIPDADYRTMVNELVEIYRQAADTIDRIVALPDPDGADKTKKTSLMEELNGYIVTDANAVSATLSKNLQTHRAEVDITNEAKALDDYLQGKSGIF